MFTNLIEKAANAKWSLEYRKTYIFEEKDKTKEKQCESLTLLRFFKILKK